MSQEVYLAVMHPSGLGKALEYLNKRHGQQFQGSVIVRDQDIVEFTRNGRDKKVKRLGSLDDLMVDGHQKNEAAQSVAEAVQRQSLLLYPVRHGQKITAFLTSQGIQYSKIPY